MFKNNKDDSTSHLQASQSLISDKQDGNYQVQRGKSPHFHLSNIRVPYRYKLPSFDSYDSEHKEFCDWGYQF